MTAAGVAAAVPVLAIPPMVVVALGHAVFDAVSR